MYHGAAQLAEVRPQLVGQHLGRRAVERHEPFDRVRVLVRSRPGNRASPVVTDECRPLTAEGTHELDHVAGERVDVVRPAHLGLSVPALVGCHGAVAGLRERRQLPAPRARQLREAVKEDDQRPVGGARGECVHAQAVRLNRDLFDRLRFGHVWTNGHTTGRMDIWRRGSCRSSLDVVPSSAVLLAEPEPESRRYLERHLSDDGFRVLEAPWSARALDLAECAAPDIVIASEPELCRRLREGEPGRRWDRNVPVILLAEPGADAVTRVRALEQGADDVVERHLYIELVARMRALLRRAGVGQADLLEAGGLVVDRRARQVRVAGRPVALAGREFDLAARLASEPQRVFTKQELLRDVWGVRTALRTRTVDSHASRLRRKLRLADGGEYVVNVWGVGYRLLP